MATPLENYRRAKQQLSDILVEITASPKPTYSVGGQSVSWSEYLRLIQESIDRLDEMIGRESPFELRSTGVAR